MRLASPVVGSTEEGRLCTNKRPSPKNGRAAGRLPFSRMRPAFMLLAGVAAIGPELWAQTQPGQTGGGGTAPANRSQLSSAPGGPTVGTIALTGPSAYFEQAQTANRPQPPVPNPPSTSGIKATTAPVPRVIPLEPLPGGNGQPAASPPSPRVIRFPVDDSGMLPDRPSVPVEARTKQEVATDLSNMIEGVTEPEAEISLVEGQTRSSRVAAN